ncbi:PAS/PAC sensor hybrid histidine kinase [Herbaspirillum sp. GW103]|jgi:PAS domain S-box-containing protein|uniref:histidine kinase famiy protein n=1 Tax=unclassified Herbaspirillum TaxID=2624150 RepID=UPI00025E3580|nr:MULTISPECIES: histidine kinase famiy protein [unclassified Herbaspirillum]EIJ47643.1 PAS/PAC sensor hybrid histidine kinase [Herbaspirillum sp. GW103]MCI1006656.1 PAS domain-containing protein [Herbaspirillum sp. C7C8]NUT61362.1 PAS domain-containing protein [Herbaspirillum sp. C9C3]
MPNIARHPTVHWPADDFNDAGIRNDHAKVAVGDDANDIFFAAVEMTRMPMIVSDPNKPDNPIIFVNNAFMNMTGYSRAEVVGKNCRFLQGPETDRSVVAQVRQAVAERREMATELLNYRKNGSTFWNALFISPVYDQRGELKYFFSSQLDISRRRDAEQALGQARKMEALGQLTGGIAHDFNNLLQVISGYLDIINLALRSDTPDLSRVSRSADSIRKASGKAAMLTQQLLAFARKQRLEGRTINLNSLTEGFTDLVQRTLGGDIVVRTQLTPGLWNCRLDPTQMEVALLNVLINARDAMSGKGTVRIHTSNEDLTSEDRAIQLGVKPGLYVCIAVTDNGPGIPADILPRVMDPFFTTKEEGKGTGLGLSMVYGFVKQSGGSVRISSSVQSGTTVSIYFPATQDQVGGAFEYDNRTHTQGGHEHVLVVDDRIEVAELAQAMLESLGYRVTMVNSPTEALQVLRAEPKVDLLFTDLIMPGSMNGVVLAREARRMVPSIKILLTTGYASESIERHGADGEFPVIDKPYRHDELARKIRIVLDGATGVS